MFWKPDLRTGMIGTGFMGKAHAHAFGFAAAPMVFDLRHGIVLDTSCDVTEEAVDKVDCTYGFKRASTDWCTMVADHTIDIVSITAPNALHNEMSLAAIAAGKYVYCEKPLALRAVDAAEISGATESAGVKTQVGFSYLCNPMLVLAREKIAAGELSEILGYRGIHAVDYIADPASPYTFRHDLAGGQCFGRPRQPRAVQSRIPLGTHYRGHGGLRDDDSQTQWAPGRGRRRRSRLPAARKRCQWLDREQLELDWPQEAARLRGLRNERGAGLHPEAPRRIALL
jgi:hypothetical protein